MKTVSSKVVVQSIAFRVVSIYWQGVAPLISKRKRDQPPLEASGGALCCQRMLAFSSFLTCQATSHTITVQLPSPNQ